jgi:hypothetical protein
MLDGTSLLFPSFYRVGETDFNGRKKSSIPIYQLDWEEIEIVKESKYAQWAQGWIEREKDRDGEDTYIPPQVSDGYKKSLPDKYFNIINDAQFAITSNYMDEIRRNARRAVEEWDIRRGFDTCVRDHCLKPSQSHIEVAFYLTADCYYSAEKDYYSRHDGYGIIMKNLMLYSFWKGQTGGGLLFGKAEFHHLYNMLERKMIQAEWKLVIAQMLKDFHDDGRITYDATDEDLDVINRVIERDGHYKITPPPDRDVAIPKNIINKDE